jgi:hypothetical protein
VSFFTDLFTPETWNKFREVGAGVRGFTMRQRRTAEQLVPGDMICCYVTRLSRWSGILEVISAVFVDTTPIFMDPDPYVVRFKVRPIIMLDLEQAIPIFDRAIWSNLAITRNLRPREFGWAQIANLRTSLRRLSDADGNLLAGALREQTTRHRLYPLSELDKKRLAVSAPSGALNKPIRFEPQTKDSSRESIKIRATLARLGIEMGFQIWVRRNNKQSILELLPVSIHDAFLSELPFNYDEVTLSKIEQIDVMWLHHRAVAHAFEIEHATAVYPGLLRMGALLALQPNTNIRLHIVGPDDKRQKLIREMKRPVFSLIAKEPLHKSCSFLPYSAVESISQMADRGHLNDKVIGSFEKRGSGLL